MAIDLTDVNLFADLLCQGYARALGITGYGVGEPGGAFGAADSYADLITAINATADSDIILQMLQQSVNAKNAMSGVKIACPRNVLNKMESLVRALTSPTTFANLEAFLTYYNTGAGGTNTGLQSPYWRALYYRWKGAFPAATNLYYECKAGTVFANTDFTGNDPTGVTVTTHTNALRKIDVTGAGTQSATAGDTISTNFHGGVPYLTVSGFAGASDTVTVTGTQSVAGTRTAGKTWTATVAGDGSVALASGGGNAATAGALIVACSAVTVGNNITNGDIYVEAWKPSGRQAIP